MRRNWVVGAIATGATALAVTGAAFGSGASGSEQFTFVSTSFTGHTFSAIGTGVFTAGGTANLPGKGKGGQVTFANGTVQLTHKQIGKPVATMNAKACYFAQTAKGTFTLVSGTGAYKGITGSGTYTSSFRFVGPIVNGKCGKGKPVAVQGIITATGHVTL